MKALRFLICVVLVSSLSGHCFSQDNQENTLDGLRALLKSRSIAKVQLLRIPDDVMTSSTVTPETLRVGAIYSVIYTQEITLTFDPLLSGLTSKNESHPSDLRWGVLFFDVSGREVGSLFTDRYGQFGYFDGESVSFGSKSGGNLAKRLHSIIANLR